LEKLMHETELLSKAESPAALEPAQAASVVACALDGFDVASQRVLCIIPDSTRTCPLPLMVEMLCQQVTNAAALDFIVALGTHMPMDDAALSKLIGQPVTNGQFDGHKIYNHEFDNPAALAQVGTIPASEIERLSEGRMSLDVPVNVNRHVTEYDALIVLGPVFPHEVMGFSGGNKYYYPGCAGAEMIDTTHWLGALLTSRDIIGTMHTPVREMINIASAMIEKPKLLLAMVMHGETFRGLHAGGMIGAWQSAAKHSESLDIIFVDKPFQRVISCVPEMYDDLWTGAKGMYKLEPAIADGGEVVIYAPHIDDVSYVHGALLDEIGYHVRDYFLAQWDKFKDYPWGILAHSTHLRGEGTFLDGVETPRIAVTLATKIPRDRCEKIGLGYLDPDTLNPDDFRGQEADGVVVIDRAGEVLYRKRV
jgi:nickel-dependent lactate racemase